MAIRISERYRGTQPRSALDSFAARGAVGVGNCWDVFRLGGDVVVLGAARRIGQMGEAVLVCSAAVWVLVWSGCLLRVRLPAADRAWRRCAGRADQQRVRRVDKREAIAASVAVGFSGVVLRDCDIGCRD